MSKQYPTCGPLYGERDAMALGQHYGNHIHAMTREQLHSKSDIAAELAWRDQQIEQQQARIAELERLIEHMGHKAELYDEACALVGTLGHMNVTNAVSALQARITELERLFDGECEQAREREIEYHALRRERDSLQQQAEIHAQEARTANATIAEIYQLVTGATGEPGRWNGAEPVRKRLATQIHQQGPPGGSECQAHARPAPSWTA